MKTFDSERFARISSIGSTFLLVMLGGFFFLDLRKTVSHAAKPDAAMRRALERKVMLQARIELCAMRDRGELPAGSTQCGESEKKELESYRRELREIDTALRIGRNDPSVIP